MSKRAFSNQTWTPVGVADTTNMTNSGYMALQGGSSTARIRLMEIYCGGQASSSTPCNMAVARDSTVGATLSALSGSANDAPLTDNASAFSSPPQPFISATTVPQRSSSAKLLALSFNAFGGIIRWVSAPDEEIWMYGNAASLGEISLSAYTGGTPGAIGSHLIYEQL
jgi:hypothetical protein